MKFSELRPGDIFQAKRQCIMPFYMKGAFRKIHPKTNRLNPALAANAERFPIPKSLTEWEEAYWNLDESVTQISNGHVTFIGKHEYFIRVGELYKAPLTNVVMPDGYRCGRWECSERMADVHIAQLKYYQEEANA